ncbi:MAG: hypothetical protein HDT20_03865 [Oscillibacter sp.]|nr:hypothetical protein [Oscillibacter sp.]
MAKIGMYGVYYAKAVVKNGVVTGYTGGAKMMGKAISAEFSPSKPDDNPLYAINGVSENDSSGASGGTLKNTLDRLTMEAAADLFGLTVKTVKVTVDGQEIEGKSLDYTGLEQSAPVGAAYIRMNQEDDVRSHEVVFYRRVVYSMPTEKAQTKGEKIEWQTPELEATVFGLEGDGSKPWYRSVVFPTQAAAIAFIEEQLGEKPAVEEEVKP